MAVVRSPLAHGVLRAVRVARARSSPGVLAVRYVGPQKIWRALRQLDSG